MEPKTRNSWLSDALVVPVRNLKAFSYNPRLLAVARGLHLTNMLRQTYQWLTGGKRNILRVNLGRFEVLFHTHSASEYRVIEHHFVGYETNFLDALLSSLGEGDVFLDVGSHIGQFTVPMAKAVGSRGLVLAVDPEVRAGAQLEANLKLNGLTNVRILRVALGDECGESRLAWKEGGCPSLVRVSTEDRDILSTTAPTPTCGLEVVSIEVGDQLMVREHLPIPKGVKIDVEGFEFQVIRGLRRTLRNASCRLLCCEIHPAYLPGGTTSQLIIEEVKSLGFTDIVMTKRLRQTHMVARKNHSQALWALEKR